MISRTFRRHTFASVNYYCSSSKCERVQAKYDGGEIQTNYRSVKHLLDHSAAFIETKPTHAEDKWATLPYVEGTIISKENRRDLDIHRPKIEPEDTSIILFPGQGSQFVGMAKSLAKIPEAKDVFDYASEILNYDLLKLCNEGPKRKLNEISYSQPAVMVTSLATLELLKEHRPSAINNCVAAAGFSLGEITALVFAGALPFDQALQLVQIRAEAMKAATEVNKGGMATVIYGPDSMLKLACKKSKEWCAENGIKNAECAIANYMFPRYKVVAGNEEALKFIEANLTKFKLRGMRRIPSNGPFHTRLMNFVVDPFTKALEQIQIEDPIIKVYSNINGFPYMSAGHILKQLPQQIVRPVKWEQTMHNLYARQRGITFPRTFVCGPGNALKAILGNVNARAWNTTIKVGD